MGATTKTVVEGICPVSRMWLQQKQFPSSDEILTKKKSKINPRKTKFVNLLKV